MIICKKNIYLKEIWFPRSSRVSNTCFSRGTAALPPLPMFPGINSRHSAKDSVSHVNVFLLIRNFFLNVLSDKLILGTTFSKYPVMRVAGVLSVSRNNIARYSNSSSDSQRGGTNSSNSSWRTSDTMSQASAILPTLAKKVEETWIWLCPVTTACQPRTVENVFYWKPQPFQPKPVSVETVDPNRTRP